jgi:hypothetical protein
MMCLCQSLFWVQVGKKVATFIFDGLLKGFLNQCRAAGLAALQSSSSCQYRGWGHVQMIPLLR